MYIIDHSIIYHTILQYIDHIVCFDTAKPISRRDAYNSSVVSL